MKHHPRSTLPLVLPLLALMAACSSGSGEPTGTGGSTGQTTGSDATSAATGTGGASTSASTGAAGTGGGDIACMGPGYKDPTAPDLKIGTVTAKIVDLNGAPAPDDLQFQVCGTNLCFSGIKGSMGSFAITGTATALKKPLFKFGDARAFAKLGIPVPAGDTSFGTLTTAALPANGPALEAGKAVTSGDVTITMPAGGVAGFDELTYPELVDQQLRTVTIPVDKATKVLSTAPAGITQLYGVGPLETVFCPPATVTVPNADSAALPANTDVEFWILGLDGDEEQWAPYGAWQKVSEGKVSADGKTISTTEGLPLLSTFGIRKKP